MAEFIARMLIILSCLITLVVTAEIGAEIALNRIDRTSVCHSPTEDSVPTDCHYVHHAWLPN